MGKSTKRVIFEKQGQFKPLVYICAPYSGDTKSNIEKAICYAKFAYDRGAIPITPHVMFPFLEDSIQKDRDAAMFMDLILLGKCQEVWVFGDEISHGMQEELLISKRRQQTIRYFKGDDYEDSIRE